MIVVYLIFLAVIQAVTEFLPVSSLGHLCILEQYMGIGHETGLLSETMLHLGSAAAIIFLFRKDLKKIGLGLLGMFMDMIGNLNLYIHNKKTGESLGYARIVTGTYRKTGALLVISMIPTALLGLTGKRLALLAADSQIVPGIGFLLTGVFLLVTDLNKSGGKKGPREASYDSAMWIGICQGIAVFPGISRMGFTLCAALLCGYNRKFAVRFSVFMSLPAIICICNDHRRFCGMSCCPKYNSHDSEYKITLFCILFIYSRYYYTGIKFCPVKGRYLREDQGGEP